MLDLLSVLSVLDSLACWHVGRVGVLNVLGVLLCLLLFRHLCVVRGVICAVLLHFSSLLGSVIFAGKSLPVSRCHLVLPLHVVILLQ